MSVALERRPQTFYDTMKRHTACAHSRSTWRLKRERRCTGGGRIAPSVRTSSSSRLMTRKLSHRTISRRHSHGDPVPARPCLGKATYCSELDWQAPKDPKGGGGRKLELVVADSRANRPFATPTPVCRCVPSDLRRTKRPNFQTRKRDTVVI